MGTEEQKLYADFKAQLHQKVDGNVKEAKKLVNLYRHLDFFGQDFIPQLNKMILQASPEVKAILPSIMGGGEILDYAEFISHKSQHAVENEGGDSALATYLPDPDQMPAVGSGDAGLAKAIERQTQLLEKLLAGGNK